MSTQAWELVHEYGEGCKVYLDKQRLEVSGSTVKAFVRHYRVPPGEDKRNEKPVREIVFVNDYDTERNLTKPCALTFYYLDGTVSEMMTLVADWSPAQRGSLIELNFVKSLTKAKKRKWWPF